MSLIGRKEVARRRRGRYRHEVLIPSLWCPDSVSCYHTRANNSHSRRRYRAIGNRVKVISNLQLLRAFCALGVVYYHTGNTIFGMHTELGGVALFFCISGFIMAHIPQKSAAQFMTDRLIRVVPLYWIATLAFFFWTNSGMSNPTYVWPMLWGKLTEDPLFIPRWFLGNTGLTKDGAIQNLVMSLLFIPYKDHAGDMHPLLGVGWTLNLEMFFYCIYALSIAVRASIAPILACAT